MSQRNETRTYDRPGLSQDQHRPFRPLWICRRCANPWPCAIARLQLKGEFSEDRIGLCVYMCSMLYAACEDLVKLNVHEFDADAAFVRFVGWVSQWRRG